MILTNDKEKNGIVGLGFAGLMAQTFFVLLSGQFFSLVMSIVVARLLGPAGRGQIAVIILYPTLLFTMGHLSVYRALTVHFGLKKYPLNTYCGSLLFFIMAMSAFLIAGFLITFFCFNAIFIQKIPFFIILVSLGILPCFLFVQIFTSILQTQHKIKQVNVVTFMQSAAALVFMILFLYTIKAEIFLVILSYFLANLSAAILAFYFLYKITSAPWNIDFNLLKQLIFDGVKLHIGIIAIFLFLKIDQLMLNYYKESSTVGFYTIAVSFTEILLIIPLAIQNVFYAKISTMLIDKADMAKKTMMIYKHNLLLLFISGIILFSVSKTAIRFFYGDVFLPSFIPLAVLLPGAFFLYLNNILTNYLVGMKRFLFISFITSFAAGLNIALNMFFIPRYAAAGAALASTITYLIIGGVTIGSFLKVSKTTLSEFIKNLSFSPSDFMLYRTFLSKLLRRDYENG